MNLLLGEHHMFHPVDAQVLLRAHATVDGALELGHARYEVLVLAADPDDDESRNAVEAAHAAGVRVLTPELPPAELLSELAAARVVSVRATGSTAELPDVWSLVRETGTQYLVLLANTTGAPVTVDVVVHEPVGSWDRWNCESGAVTSLPGLDRLQLPAWGSALLVGSRLPIWPTEQAEEPRTVAAVVHEPESVPLGGSWERVLDRPNALRLNRWLAHAVPADDDPEGFAVPGSDDSGWTAVEAVPLRYRDTEQNVWVDQLALPVRPATVWYRRHLEIDAAGVAGDGMLRIEDGAIEGAWTLYVNGAEVDPATGRAEAGPAGYLADVLLLPIGHLLTAGDNVLALRIAALPESPRSGAPELRTPLHLVGTFDVVGTPEVRKLQQPLPESGFGDRAGIPHFAGRIAYRRRQQPGGVPLILPDTIGDPVGVSFADDDLGVRCWPPYRWDLPPGHGDLVVEVTTTMLPFFEGQQWLDGRAVDR